MNDTRAIPILGMALVFYFYWTGTNQGLLTVYLKKMSPKQLVRRSRFLSLILRHQPEKINLQLDQQGWASVNELLSGMEKHGHAISQEELEQIVAENDKKRFSFNERRTKIRANQGHSIKIDHGYEALRPPDQLYHGTATRFLDSIMARGLQRQKRHHVHLSAERATAEQVGRRHGKVVVLSIDSAGMHAAGYPFYRSENNVWLTVEVPVKYITLLKYIVPRS